MRWTIELYGADERVVVETDSLREAYENALQIYFFRRVPKFTKPVSIEVKADGKDLHGRADTCLAAFALALGAALDLNTWAIDTPERNEVTEVQTKLASWQSTNVVPWPERNWKLD